MLLVLALIFALLTLVAVVLQKTYSHIPVRELKRRVRKGDEVAKALHSAAAYGISLDILLWLIIGAAAAGFVIIFARLASAWLAFFGAISLLWFAFGWTSKARPGSLSLKLGQWLAPVLSWLLIVLHPLFNLVVNFIRRHRPITMHTGLFEKEDLLELIEAQKVSSHNRMDEAELTIAAHALTFGDKLIREVMTPKRMLRIVHQSEPTGPVLMNELHTSGHSRFPVVGETADKIVGTLYIRDLLDKPLDTTGQVSDFMHKKVYYVQEEQDLWHALDAFLKTKHHLFIVVNNFEEIVGVVSIEDVLEQILGERIVDEFDRYDDLRAVAQLEARHERKQKAETVVK